MKAYQVKAMKIDDEGLFIGWLIEYYKNKDDAVARYHELKETMQPPHIEGIQDEPIVQIYEIDIV